MGSFGFNLVLIYGLMKKLMRKIICVQLLGCFDDSWFWVLF